MLLLPMCIGTAPVATRMRAPTNRGPGTSLPSAANCPLSNPPFIHYVVCGLGNGMRVGEGWAFPWMVDASEGWKFRALASLLRALFHKHVQYLA